MVFNQRTNKVVGRAKWGGVAVVALLAGMSYAQGAAAQVNAGVSGTPVVAAGGASAFGVNANAGGLTATAIGSDANANGLAAGAFGAGSFANGSFATAVGTNSTANGIEATAFGNQARANGIAASAFGQNAVGNGDQTLAVGQDSTATGAAAASIGTSSFATGDRATAVGSNSNATGTDATAIGQNSIANGNFATSLGSAANATGASATAIGYNSNTSSLTNAVALGSGSTAAASSNVTTNPAGLTGAAGSLATGSSSVVSVGAVGAERQIQNVAAGAISSTSTDAVNGSQLNLVNNAVVTNAANIATNTANIATNTANIATNTTNIAANTAAIVTLNTTVGALGTEVDAQGTGTATALGGGATYNTTTGAFTGPSYTTYGTANTNVGSAIANLQALGPISFSTTGLPTTANNTARTNSATLVGGAAGTVMLNNLTDATLASGSNQAVTGGQLFTTNANVTALTTVVTALGAEVDSQGTTTASTFGGGATYNTTTGAITGGAFATYGAAATNTTGNVGTALSNVLTLGPVQFTATGTGTTGTGVGGQRTQFLTLVGAAAGTVTLNNVGPATIFTGSTQAVNGSQVYDVANSIAARLGGGATASTTTGVVSAPTYTIQGTNYSDVGSAFGALNTAVNNNAERANAGIASAMAIGGLQFGSDAGAVTMGGAVSSYEGKTAVAFGVGGVSADGLWRYSASGGASQAGGATRGGGVISVSRVLK